MKFTNKTLYLTLIIGMVSSCQSKPTVNYADELKGCLKPSDIELLNSLSMKFENHLSKTYDLKGNDLYKQYLKDVATTNFPSDFFKYSNFEDDMNKFRKSEFYQRSWVRTSSFNKEIIVEVPPTIVNGEIQKQEVYDPFVLDPNGNYVKCVTDKNESKAMKDYLDIVVAGIDIAPPIVAQTLYDNLSEKELNGDLTRLIIAINFHYQIGLYITEKKN